MKKLVLLFIFFSIKVSFAQNQLLAGNNMTISQSLTSTNGKYKFMCVESAGKYHWIISNTTTQEILFSTIGKQVLDPEYPYEGDATRLYFRAGYEFREYPYTYDDGRDVNLQEFYSQVPHDDGLPTIPGHLPLLIFEEFDMVSFKPGVPPRPIPTATDDITRILDPSVPRLLGIIHHPENGFDLIGLPSAYQQFIDVRITLNPATAGGRPIKQKVPETNDVFVKLPSGIYTVPPEKRATALKLLDDGNLIIVNSSNQILWESATSQIQTQNATFNKVFKDLNLFFVNGLGLVSPGKIEIINTTVYQDVSNVVLIANDYINLTHNGGVTDLSIYNQATAYIDLTCLPLRALTKSNKKLSQIRTAKNSENNKLQETANQELSVVAYPNPTTGLVTFETSDKNDKIIYITIADINGRIVGKYADTTQIDISQSALGTYFYKVITATNEYTGKILKN